MVIESMDPVRGGRGARVLSFDIDERADPSNAAGWVRREETSSPECMWDIAGDRAIAAAIARARCDEENGEICCLVPSAGETEGTRYSKDVLRRLFLAQDIQWRYAALNGCAAENGYGIPLISIYNRREALRKEFEKTMNDRLNQPLSLEEYRRSIAPKENNPASGNESHAISPIKGGNDYAISNPARQKALNFAHPVDTEIIRKLDNPAINGVFNKVVQASIDASYGLALASGIHLSPDTYPELYRVVKECADTLGIPVPYVIVSDTVKGINACTAGTNQFAFIAISSLLPLVMKEKELKFVIGHECGHLALGHVVYHTAVSMMGVAGSLLPLVGPIIAKTMSFPLNAWSRRSEISADRAGLICCGDVEVAKRALFKLVAGILNTDGVDIDNYVRESEQMLDGATFGKLPEYLMQHPIIPKRIKALDLFVHSERYAQITNTYTGEKLLSDKELEQEIEKIISVM